MEDTKQLSGDFTQGSIGTKLIRFMILTCIVFSFIGYFNGHGRTLPVMLQGITASFFVRIPFSYLFSLKEGANLVDIGLAVPLASVYGILFFTICFLAGRRKSKKQQIKSK